MGIFRNAVEGKDHVGARAPEEDLTSDSLPSDSVVSQYPQGEGKTGQAVATQAAIPSGPNLR